MTKKTKQKRILSDLSGGEWNPRFEMRQIKAGFPYKGIEPGKWEPDHLGLPPDCPVRPLGFKNDTFFLLNARGAVSTLPEGASAGKDRWDRIFAGYIRYLWWAFPSYKQVTIEEEDADGKIHKKKIYKCDENYAAEKLRQVMFDAIELAGPWDMVDRVRGRGAWKDDQDRLVIHLGDRVYIGGKLHEPGPGDIDGYVYPKLPAITPPADEFLEAGTDSPASELLAMLRTWQWARPEVDPELMLGWICQSMIGGALGWRSTVFLTGDRAVGKSTAQRLIKYILGDMLIQTKETTPAGLYQHVGHDSRPVGVDELEAGADNRRVMDVVKLSRLASDGGVMFRGGAHHEGVEFQARSSFFFSAINPPPLNYQDRSRMAILALRPLKKTLAGPQWTETELREIGQVLLRRLMWWWEDYRLHNLIQTYRSVMIEKGGHDSRGADTFGTLAACAHAALYDNEPTTEQLEEWGRKLSVKQLHEFDVMDQNWRACFNHMIAATPDVLRNGAPAKTIAGILERVKAWLVDSDANFGISPKEANKYLNMLGMSVGCARGGVQSWENLRLFVLGNHQSVARVFEGTPWTSAPGAPGVWSDAFRQAPEDYYECKVGRVGQLTGFGTYIFVGRIFAADDERGKDADIVNDI